MQQFTQMGVIAGKKFFALLESFGNHGAALSFERKELYSGVILQIKPRFPDRFCF